MSLPSQPSPENGAWTDQVRAQALDLVLIASDQRRAAERAERYFLRSAIAHGVDVDRVATAAQLDREQVLALTDPAAG